jgi:hypothetical protein
MTQRKGEGSGFFKERRVLLVLTTGLLTLLVIVLFQYVRCGEELAAAKRGGETLQTKLNASLPGGDVAQLQKKGLSHLEEALATDLMGHKELIPYKGIMGGTMGFYSKENIHVLTPRWVMASFEDGHIGGHMLLEYAVSPGGEIQWKVISSYLD